MDAIVNPTPQTWRLTITYDGTDFQGWQVQPGQTTIQGELQAALGRVTGEAPLPQGSGRTDAGVHALAQVASFHSWLPSHLRISSMRSTAHCPRQSVSPKPESREAQHFMHGIPPSPRPTSTASSAAPIARRSWHTTCIPAPGASIWQRSSPLRKPSSAHTTF